MAGPAEPGLALRAALHARWRCRTAAVRGGGPHPGPVAGGPVRGAGRTARRAPYTTAGRRPRTAGLHLGGRAGRGPSDVPRLTARRARSRGRAVPGAGALRPEPQCTGDGGGVAVGTSGLGPGRPHGGAGGGLRGHRPHASGGRDRRRGTAPVRSGHGARRSGAESPGGPRRTVVVAGPAGGGRTARCVAGPAGAAYAGGDRRAAGCGRLAGRAARGVVPCRRAAARPRLVPGPARPPLGPGGRGSGCGVPGRAGEAAVDPGSGRPGGLGAGFIATHGLSEAFQLLGVCAVPWAAPLGRAVVDALDIARDAGSYPWSFTG